MQTNVNYIVGFYGKYYIIGSLLEQNIINDIFQDIPLVCMAAILKTGI